MAQSEKVQIIENAGKDAVDLIREGEVIKMCWYSLVIARRLEMVALEAMGTSLREDWDVANPALVFETLVMAAKDKAGKMEDDYPGLLKDLFSFAVPLLHAVSVPPTPEV